jgi:hypothetical protein
MSPLFGKMRLISKGNWSSFHRLVEKGSKLQCDGRDAMMENACCHHLTAYRLRLYEINNPEDTG